MGFKSGLEEDPSPPTRSYFGYVATDDQMTVVIIHIFVFYSMFNCSRLILTKRTKYLKSDTILELLLHLIPSPKNTQVGIERSNLQGELSLAINLIQK